MTVSPKARIPPIAWLAASEKLKKNDISLPAAILEDTLLLS